MPRFSQLLALLVAVAALPAAREAPEEQPVLPDVPVQFRHEAIFHVRAQVGRLAPAERARAIEGRLAALSPSAAGEVRVDERPGSSDLYAGDRFVMSVTEQDAGPTGRTRQQLAADYARSLREALEREAKGRSVRGLVVAVLLTTVATAGFLLVLRASRKGFDRLYALLRSWKGTRVRTVRFQGVEIMSEERCMELLVNTARALRVLIVAIAASIYIDVVLGFYPWTRGVARAVLEYAWQAVASVLADVLAFLPNLVSIAVILAVTRILLKAARLLASRLGNSSLVLAGFYPEWADPTYKFFRFLVVALAAVLMFPYLPGSASPAFRGVSIFLGVLFSLGSTSAVSNIVAGGVLTYMRPFSVGDRVKIAETVGDVIERNLLVVRVRTIKNVEVTLSNSMVLGNHMLNYSAAARAGGLALHTTVTIGYDAPWRKVHELLVSAAESVEGILSTPKPFVLQNSLDDFYVSYEINAYTDRVRDMVAITSRLHQAIQDHFFAAGVEIMSPHYTSIRDGNAVALPADQLPDSYEPPSFRVERAERSGRRGRTRNAAGGDDVG